MKQLLIGIFSVLLNIGYLEAKDVNYVNTQQICKPPYSTGAILRREGMFVDDFLTLHCLLRMAEPVSVFEIGTCSGEGTLIIKNAVKDSVVYSLDLPPGESTYWIEKLGGVCYLPYVQLIGNSQTINYKDYYPIDSWFIDGHHDYKHVFYETTQALLSEPQVIVWHDADIPEVFQAIQDGLDPSTYVLYRVNNTRIAFAVPEDSNINGVIND